MDRGGVWWLLRSPREQKPGRRPEWARSQETVRHSMFSSTVDGGANPKLASKLAIKKEITKIQ